ncbi:hypothetical protein AOCH_003887, partial [Aspergillus ochraceoroseus]
MDLLHSTVNMEEELDSEISSIRAEIRNLQRRRRFLASSILSSDILQSRFKAHQPQQEEDEEEETTTTTAAATRPAPLSTLNEDISPLVRAAGIHAQSNHHRIAFSTTTFPFKDPSPNNNPPNSATGNANLLGVRIDIGVRSGRFSKPYYLLLRRVRVDAAGKQERTRVRVHRHTIPAFIPVERLERVFLPVPVSVQGDEGEGERLNETKKKSSSARGQDLRGFVREVRRQLVAWHTRMDAVSYLREQLGVIRRGVDEDEYGYEDEHANKDGLWDRDVLGDSGAGETRLKKNELGIVALAPTALEASYVRLEWEDGRVGRLKVSNSGVVERAVVIGDTGRDKALEAAITTGDRKLLTVLDRLKKYSLSS